MNVGIDIFQKNKFQERLSDTTTITFFNQWENILYSLTVKLIFIS